MRPSGRRRSCTSRRDGGISTPREIQHSAVGTQRVVHAGNLSALPSRRARSSSLRGHVGERDRYAGERESERTHVRICIHKARAYLRKRRDFTRRGTVSLPLPLPPPLSLSLSLAVSRSLLRRYKLSGYPQRALVGEKEYTGGALKCVFYIRPLLHRGHGRAEKETEERDGRSFVEASSSNGGSYQRSGLLLDWIIIFLRSDHRRAIIVESQSDPPSRRLGRLTKKYWKEVAGSARDAMIRKDSFLRRYRAQDLPPPTAAEIIVIRTSQ